MPEESGMKKNNEALEHVPCSFNVVSNIHFFNFTFIMYVMWKLFYPSIEKTTVYQRILIWLYYIMYRKFIISENFIVENDKAFFMCIRFCWTMQRNVDCTFLIGSFGAADARASISVFIICRVFFILPAVLPFGGFCLPHIWTISVPLQRYSRN